MKKLMILTAILSLNLTFLTGSDAFARQPNVIASESFKHDTRDNFVLGDPLVPGCHLGPQSVDSDGSSEVAQPTLGDLNDDGRVDSGDLSIFLANFGGEATGELQRADFDLNGYLNQIDLVVLLNLMRSDSNPGDFR